MTQLRDDRLKWVAHIGGVHRQWEAKILEQVPDHRVAWASTEGATNAGTIEFRDLTGSVAGSPASTMASSTATACTPVAGMPEPATVPRPYNRFEHPFDQTGGLVDFEGESDETSDGENYSSAERKSRRHDQGFIPPYGGSPGQL